MIRTMANAPAVLRGYLDLNRAMKRSHLDRRITERIALAAQEWIGCAYCVAAHTAAAQNLGLSDRDVALARQGIATDPAIASIVAFGQQVLLRHRGLGPNSAPQSQYTRESASGDRTPTNPTNAPRAVRLRARAVGSVAGVALSCHGRSAVLSESRLESLGRSGRRRDRAVPGLLSNRLRTLTRPPKQ